MRQWAWRRRRRRQKAWWGWGGRWQPQRVTERRRLRASVVGSRLTRRRTRRPISCERLCDRRVSPSRSSSDSIDSSRTLCSSSGMPRVKCIRTRELLEGERPPSLLKHGLQSVQQRPDALSVLLEGELARGGIAQHVRVHASRGRVARAIHRQRFDGRAVRREVRVVTARVTVAAVVEQREGREGAEELRAGGGRGGRGGTKGARGRSGWARWWD